MPLLDSLETEAKLIQVTSMATKHANKNFLSWLGSFFPHFSLGVERWLWIGWVVSFGGFDCFLLNHFLAHHSSLKMRSQVGNLLF
jgi:hypothetical protein